jgi:hypothetical protein
MVDQGLALIGGVGASALLAAAARTRLSVRRPARLEPAELGLAEFPPLGAFVQYSAPGNTACRVSLNRLAAAVAPHRDRATVIELHSRPAGVVALPTVIYIDAGGAELRRWSSPPAREELAAVLSPGDDPSASRAARCSPAAVR